MKRILTILTLASLLPSAALAKLNVVATTPDLGSIAQAVGGDQIALTTLARPTEDPHFVDAKPSFIVKLNKADALIHGGAELEAGWLPKLLEGARNPRLAADAPGNIACNQGIPMLEVPGTLDRSLGDIHAAGNPHYVVDPENAKIIAQHLATAFGRLDAANAGLYEANANQFIAQLTARLAGWQQTLAPFQGAPIVAYHNSWPYFARRFGLKIDTFLEPKPGIPPSPAHLAEVLTKMKAQQIRVIFVDPFLNRKTAETVARETGAAIVDVSQFPGGVKGSEDGYIALLDCLVNATAKALGNQP